MKKTKRKTKIPIWRTRDGREIPINELGDQHLVYILKRVEENITHSPEMPNSKRALPIDLVALYGLLVGEGIKRGLFEWVLERKYLLAAAIKVKNMAEQEVKYPIRKLRSGLVIDPKRHPNMAAMAERFYPNSNLRRITE